MKYFIIFKKVLTLTLSISLIITSLPSQSIGDIFLAPPSSNDVINSDLLHKLGEELALMGNAGQDGGNIQEKDGDKSTRRIFGHLSIITFSLSILTYIILQQIDVPFNLIFSVFVSGLALSNAFLFLYLTFAPWVSIESLFDIKINYPKPLSLPTNNLLSTAIKITLVIFGILMFGSVFNIIVTINITTILFPSLLMTTRMLVAFFAIATGAISLLGPLFPYENEDISEEQTQNMTSRLQKLSDKLFDSALRNNDSLLLESFHYMKGFRIIPQEYYFVVLHNGKDSERNLILFTPNIIKYSDLTSYLIVRRAIGFRYDAVVKYISSKKSTVFHKVFLRLFWEIYSNYQLLKRCKYFPLMIPYIIIHSFYFNVVAFIVLIPLSITNLYRIFNVRERKIFKILIKTLINDMSVPKSNSILEIESDNNLPPQEPQRKRMEGFKPLPLVLKSA